MHIAPFDNQNKPIVDIDHPLVPLNYFNIVHLSDGQTFTYSVPEYETCIVPATGTVRVDVAGRSYDDIGKRTVDVWDGEPEGVYIPTGMTVTITCQSAKAEIFIAGAKFTEVLEPFAVRETELDTIQYGSDETKTHRKIKHIFGSKYHGRVGRLLVSELYTVGTGDGLASQATSTIQKTCRKKPATTRHTISAFVHHMAPACRCCSGSIMSPAMPTTS